MLKIVFDSLWVFVYAFRFSISLSGCYSYSCSSILSPPASAVDLDQIKNAIVLIKMIVVFIVHPQSTIFMLLLLLLLLLSVDCNAVVIVLFVLLAWSEFELVLSGVYVCRVLHARYAWILNLPLCLFVGLVVSICCHENIKHSTHKPPKLISKSHLNSSTKLPSNLTSICD